MTQLSICIIETGASNPKLVEQYGRYPDMIQRWLQPHLPQARFTVRAVFEGESVDIEAHDAFIVTGSPHGVYDDLPWIKPLKEQLRTIAQKGRPLFGICFGHQIMAAAFGGTVEKSAKGWGIGLQDYHFTLPDLPDSKVLVYHQDQIITPPPETEIIGGSQHCPYGALQYPFAARSIQFHPEFTNEFVSALIQFRNDPINDREEQLSALQSIQPPNDTFARWVADFLLSGQKKEPAMMQAPSQGQ